MLVRSDTRKKTSNESAYPLKPTFDKTEPQSNELGEQPTNIKNKQLSNDCTASRHSATGFGVVDGRNRSVEA